MHLLEAESNQPSMVVDIPAEDARLSPVKVTAEDPFMADPFMALQNDLDDVSGAFVIVQTGERLLAQP